MRGRWRYAKRKDLSHKPVVDALKAVGAVVQVLESDAQAGIPDLLVGFRGRTFLLEVKRPEGTRSYKNAKGECRTKKQEAGKLSDDQKRWHQRWTGGPIDVVETPAEALKAIGIQVREYVNEMSEGEP